MSVCHGGNSDDLVSISAMTGTEAVNFCVYFNGLYKKKKKKKRYHSPGGDSSVLQHKFN